MRTVHRAGKRKAYYGQNEGLARSLWCICQVFSRSRLKGADQEVWVSAWQGRHYCYLMVGGTSRILALLRIAAAQVRCN